MEDGASATAPPAGRTTPVPVPAVSRRNGPADGPATEGLSSGLFHVGFQGGELLIKRDKDAVEDPRLERRDTTESALSEFGPPERSDSGWSTAPSTATDMTELDPGSPDVPFGDEVGDLEAEIYASSPRRSGMFSFAKAPPQKRLPFRPASMSGAPDKPLAPPRHRRLGEMAPRKSSLSISSGPNAQDADSVPGPSSSRGDPSPLSAREPWVAQPDPELDNDGGTAGHPSEGVDLPSCRAPATPPIASLPAPGDVTEDWQTHKQETKAGGGGAAETPADMDMEDDAPTPGKESTTEDDTPCVSEAAASPHSPTTPEQRPTSQCGEGADWRDGDDDNGDDDGDYQSIPEIDGGMIQGVCEQVLQQAFGLQLEHAALAGVASEVYVSVSHCLDELSHILLNGGLFHAGINTNEATRGTTSHKTVPIWSIGPTADRAGGRRGGGGGDGNGEGSRKRSNDGHDDRAGPGDGNGSPGGGKRQRVSAAHKNADMCYSCPFRKRNPLRFNIRKCRSCAFQPYSDFTLVK